MTYLNRQFILMRVQKKIMFIYLDGNKYKIILMIRFRIFLFLEFVHQYDINMLTLPMLCLFI